MDLERIDDSEILYRTVRESYPNAFINGKPTAAIFISNGGTSVDRDGGRDESVIIEQCKWRFKDYKSTVKISAKQCRDAGTFLNPEKTKRNPYHAGIYDSKAEDEVSFSKAMMLASLCVEVKC